MTKFCLITLMSFIASVATAQSPNSLTVGYTVGFKKSMIRTAEELAEYQRLSQIQPLQTTNGCNVQVRLKGAYASKMPQVGRGWWGFSEPIHIRFDYAVDADPGPNCASGRPCLFEDGPMILCTTEEEKLQGIREVVNKNWATIPAIEFYELTPVPMAGVRVSNKTIQDGK